MDRASHPIKRRPAIPSDDDDQDDVETTMSSLSLGKKPKGAKFIFTIKWHQCFRSWKVSSDELLSLADRQGVEPRELDHVSWPKYVNEFIQKRNAKCKSCFAKTAHNCEVCRRMRAQDFWLEGAVREYVESQVAPGCTRGSVVLPVTLGQQSAKGEPFIHLYYRCRRDGCENAAEQSSQLCDTHGRNDRGLSSDKFLDFAPVLIPLDTKEYQVWRMPQEEDLIISLPLMVESSQLTCHSLKVRLSTDSKATEARGADIEVFPTFCRRTDRIIAGKAPLWDLRVKRTWLSLRQAEKLGIIVKQEVTPLGEVAGESVSQRISAQHVQQALSREPFPVGLDLGDLAFEDPGHSVLAQPGGHEDRGEIATRGLRSSADSAEPTFGASDELPLPGYSSDFDELLETGMFLGMQLP